MTPGPPQSLPDRRRVAAIVGAGGVLVAVTAVILVLGYVPVPDFPALADEPDPAIPGTVAFTSQSDRGPCLATVPASGGAVTRLRCDDEWWGLHTLTWTSDGDLAVLSRGRDGPMLTVLDPATGDELRRVEADDEGPVPARRPERTERDDGTRLVFAGGREGEAILRLRDADGATRDLLRVEGPRDYAFSDGQWSPDGQWALVADTRGRLLVLAAEPGNPAPRTLVDDRGDGPPGFAWHVPGEPAHTIEVP